MKCKNKQGQDADVQFWEHEMQSSSTFWVGTQDSICSVLTSLNWSFSWKIMQKVIHYERKIAQIEHCVRRDVRWRPGAILGGKCSISCWCCLCACTMYNIYTYYRPCQYKSRGYEPQFFSIFIALKSQSFTCFSLLYHGYYY